MKSGQPYRRHWRAGRLTLRLRLALWTATLLIFFGLGLVLFINIAAALTIPSRIASVLAPMPDSLQLATPPSALSATPATALMPIQPSPTPLATVTPNVEQAGERVLGQLRGLSIIGLGVVAVLGGVGAYWLAGVILRPVREVSQLARAIGAETLDRRLTLAGPQDELKELADTFDAMLDRLERAFEQQSRFVADAAHELRTPLATLRTNLEVVQADPGATVEDYREMSAALERALTRLERLVADLLLLAQGEEEVVREEIELAPLLEELFLDLRPLADKRQVSLYLEQPTDIVVRGDELLLARALSNLIENGIRYNHPGGEVRVQADRNENWIVVNISDTGFGIPAAEQIHLFERFYRADPSRTRHKGGAGLGLAIAQRIIALHGGDVKIESAPGEGSVFTVRLPLA